MGIRQLTFDEGEALNIREECTKLPTNFSVDKLREYAEDDSILIVKSGKSYFDVTSRPEIYEKAQDFDVDSLTVIDQRELRQSEMTPAFTDIETADPMAMLYQNTSQQVEEEIEEEYERKTYYLRLDQIETLRMLCYKEAKEISAMVREMLDMAIIEKGSQHGIDFKAESEKNLMNQPRKPKRRKKRKAQF